MPWPSRRKQKSWRKSLPSLREEIRYAEGVLTSHYIDDARLEAELLLMHAMGVKRSELYVRLEETITSAMAEKFRSLIKRRCSHEPTAYILNNCQFYGIDFYIDSRALIPRPESELLVEEGLKFAGQRSSGLGHCLIADVGTGSGAIAISMALHLPKTKIYAIDISPDALDVARINCEQHRTTEKVSLLLGDMLHPLHQKVDIIIANLPYVRNEELQNLSPEVMEYEPRIALSGGADGLDKISQLLFQAKKKLLPGGLVLIEIGEGQSDTAAFLAQSNFQNAQVDLIPDLSGIKRVVKILSKDFCNAQN